MGQRDGRPVVASALVAVFFRCSCCNMLDSDATRMDATSWHLTQHGPVTAVLACWFVRWSRSPPHRSRTRIPCCAVLTPGPECCIRCNSAPLDPGQDGVPDPV